jgi:hypothetical protein
MPRRDGEVFRFGTAMVLLFLAATTPARKERVGSGNELKAGL